MSKVQLIELDQQCRYCLEGDNVDDMVKPCRCAGSTAYVHKECLRNWFRQKNSRVVIPGYFNQFDTYRCEICHTKYQCEYVNMVTGESLKCTVAKYLLGITVFLFSCYIGIGALMQTSPKTAHTFSYMEHDNYWYNLLWNGFCVTHMTIGIIYILLAIAYLIKDAPMCLCYCPQGDGNGVHHGDAGGCCIAIIFIGIVGTVLLIYYDIIGRVVQRHENNMVSVLEIYNYDPNRNRRLPEHLEEISTEE